MQIFCQRALRDSVKIQSRSGLSFLFTTMPGLTPSAYWCFDFSRIFFFSLFFFPGEVTQACGVKDGERYVCHEAREHVSPLPANSSSNTHTGLQMDASPTCFQDARTAFATKKTKPSQSLLYFSRRHKRLHAERRHPFPFPSHAPAPLWRAVAP